MNVKQNVGTKHFPQAKKACDFLQSKGQDLIENLFVAHHFFEKIFHNNKIKYYMN
jgi:hypothetical protein